MRIRWIVMLVAAVPLSCDLINVADPEAKIVARPAVLSTDFNYTEADLQRIVPDTALFNEFARSYPRRCSPQLKQALVEYILTKATELHLNERQLRDAFERTGQLADSVIALPYRVEYARFESQRAWTIEFACGPDTLYADYRCYVVSSPRLEILLSFGTP